MSQWDFHPVAFTEGNLGAFWTLVASEFDPKFVLSCSMM